MCCSLSPAPSRSPFAAAESTGPRRSSSLQGSLSASSHPRVHVSNLVLLSTHVSENCLPLEAANVLRVRLVTAVEVRHHVIKFGVVMLIELAQNEPSSEMVRVAG